LGQEQSIHEIVDKENIAHLEAIAIERDWCAGQGAHEEMRHPALIFGATLMGSINAAHTEDHSR
jgi:hypothetical protein